MYSSEPTTKSPLELPLGSLLPTEISPTLSRLRSRDDSVMWWGDAHTPAPPALVPPGNPASITVAVSPVRPGHAVTVEYRVNGGPVRQTIALLAPRVHHANARLFRAVLPGQPDGLIEFLPVLRFAGQPISPRLAESAEPPRYQVGRAAASDVAAARCAPMSQGEPKTPSAGHAATRIGDDARIFDLPMQRRILSDGTECLLPIRYFESLGLLATFLTNLDRAAGLLQGTGLEAHSQEDGKAVVMLCCFEYRHCDLGPYNEVGLTVLATACGDPVPANYVTDFPVNSDLAIRAGRELWGYNKFVANIDIKSEGKKFSATVRDSESLAIGTFAGSRGSSIPAPSSDMVTFTILGGKLIKTAIRILTPYLASSGEEFRLRVGTSRHPMANNLRSLGLDGAQPVLVQYAEPFQALLFPGRVI
jgi:hypothetical protein